MFHRKPLWLVRQHNLAQQFSVRNRDDRDTRLVRRHAPHVQPHGPRIILQLVKIAPQINSGNHVVRLTIVDVQTLATCHIELIELGSIAGGCGFFSR